MRPADRAPDLIKAGELDRISRSSRSSPCRGGKGQGSVSANFWFFAKVSDFGLTERTVLIFGLGPPEQTQTTVWMVGM